MGLNTSILIIRNSLYWGYNSSAVNSGYYFDFGGLPAFFFVTKTSLLFGCAGKESFSPISTSFKVDNECRDWVFNWSTFFLTSFISSNKCPLSLSWAIFTNSSVILSCVMLTIFRDGVRKIT